MALPNHHPFDDVLEAALALTTQEQLRLVERVIATVNAQLTAPSQEVDDQPLSEEELAELLRIEPLTGTEIVARGLLGGWEDMGITDGAEWVNEQKNNRRKKFDW